MNETDARSVWDRLREYAATQPGSFTSQEALSWFRRHSPAQSNDRTIRTHIRGACWNVGDRYQFARREPFLTRIDRGVFRQATDDEIQRWRDQEPHAHSAAPSGPGSTSVHAPAAAAEVATGSPGDTPGHQWEWHTEANVQALLVTALVRDGWLIHSVANTATKEHGIDVIGSREGQTVGIEVKGFPSREYADPARAGEKKRTNPNNQAGHWYSQAILAAMKLRDKEPTWRSVIALPDFPRYRTLHSATQSSLQAAGIEVWWVFESGALEPG